jgi:hypothetical protein
MPKSHQHSAILPISGTLTLTHAGGFIQLQDPIHLETEKGRQILFFCRFCEKVDEVECGGVMAAVGLREENGDDVYYAP